MDEIIKDEVVQNEQPKPTVIVVKSKKPNDEKVGASDIPKISDEELAEALADIEEYERNEENAKSMKDIGESLLASKNKDFLTSLEKKKEFTSRQGSSRLFNPNHIEITHDFDLANEMYYELLKHSLESKSFFLTGTFDSVGSLEVDGRGNRIPYMETSLGKYRVRILITDLMWISGLQTPKRAGEYVPSTQEMMHYLDARLPRRNGNGGMTTTYKVIKFIPDEHVAYASRLMACGTEGFANFVKPVIVKKGKKPRPRIVPNMIVPARIIASTTSFVDVDIFGAEARINDEELEWGGVQNVYNSYKVNDTIWVKILKVSYGVVPMGIDSNGKPRKVKRVMVEASQRQTKPNPFEDIVKNLDPENGKYKATVIGISVANGIRFSFAQPEGTINKVFADYPTEYVGTRSNEIPRVGDVCWIRIKKIYPESETIKARFVEICETREHKAINQQRI